MDYSSKGRIACNIIIELKTLNFEPNQTIQKKHYRQLLKDLYVLNETENENEKENERKEKLVKKNC